MSIIQLDFTPEARGKSLWYRNPFRFVDAEDLLNNPRNALVFFYDLLVDRPTEFHALVRLFLYACNNLDLVRLNMTARQNEATDALIEAVGQGKPPVQYVAQKLGIHKSNASRLIQRADKSKIATLTELFDVSYDTPSIEWTPSEDAIQAKMAALPRECAGHGTDGCSGVTRGAFALCWNCHNKYGNRRNEFEPLTARWLVPEIRRIQADHRQLAINELYREHNAGEQERKTRKVRRAA